MHDHQLKLWFNPQKKSFISLIHLRDLKNILSHKIELTWIKLLQTPFPVGFKDNIYHDGNISKMPDFDVFSL